eukprot:6898694-Prorocentrum_lima.AAC.1
MTSSLVGSEMCIRDSHIPLWEVWQSTPRCQKWEHRQAMTCPVPASSTDTVSYTHLTLPTICSV